MTPSKRFFILAGNYQIATTACFNSQGAFVLNKNAFYVKDAWTLRVNCYNPLYDTLIYEHLFYKNPAHKDIEEELRTKNGTT